jgi:hypothetical protein
VERAQAQVVLAGLFQRYRAPDDIDDVDARQQILDESLRDHAGIIAIEPPENYCSAARRLWAQLGLDQGRNAPHFGPAGQARLQDGHHLAHRLWAAFS